MPKAPSAERCAGKMQGEKYLDQHRYGKYNIAFQIQAKLKHVSLLSGGMKDEPSGFGETFQDGRRRWENGRVLGPEGCNYHSG